MKTKLYRDAEKMGVEIVEELVTRRKKLTDDEIEILGDLKTLIERVCYIVKANTEYEKLEANWFEHKNKEGES